MVGWLQLGWLGVLGEDNLIRRYHTRQLDPTQLDPTLLSLIIDDPTNVVIDIETSRYQSSRVRHLFDALFSFMCTTNYTPTKTSVHRTNAR